MNETPLNLSVSYINIGKVCIVKREISDDSSIFLG